MYEQLLFRAVLWGVGLGGFVGLGICAFHYLQKGMKWPEFKEIMIVFMVLGVFAISPSVVVIQHRVGAWAQASVEWDNRMYEQDVRQRMLEIKRSERHQLIEDEARRRLDAGL